MKPQEFLQETNDFVFNSIVQPKPNKEKPKWYCEVCDETVKGIERHYPDGSDDNRLGEIVCEQCGNVLWED